MTMQTRLIAKLQALPPNRRAEVEDFIDFLAASIPVLAEIWDNPEDDVYNAV